MALKQKNPKKIEDLLQVSRETINSLIFYENILCKYNKNMNLIAKSTENQIKIRHIIDSAQVIDFIDKKIKICADLGTGAGFPGIVLAIIMKEWKHVPRFDLYEKSPKKCQFLLKVVKKLNLNVKILEKNVIEQKNLYADTVVARAFKPVPAVFEIVTKKIRSLVFNIFTYSS